MTRQFFKFIAITIFLIGQNAYSAGNKIFSSEYSGVEFSHNGEETITLDKFAGKVILLEFWAPWCKYCIRQMPSVSMLAEKYKDQADFVIVPVSIDYRGASAVKDFFKSKDISNLDIYTDEKNGLANAFGVRTIPSFFLLDKSGQIIDSFNGMQQFDEEKLLENLKK